MKPGHMLVFVDLNIPYGRDCPPSETVRCTRNTTIFEGLGHQKFYVIDRTLRKTLGPWGIVMINGKEHLIDPSVPTHLDRIPRDAVEITGKLAEDILHNRDGHHGWACCYIDRVVALMEREQRLRRLHRALGIHT